MNFRMTFYILGLLLGFEGLFMLVPTVTAVIYQEHEVWLFGGMVLFCLLAGFLISLKKPKNKTLYAKDGFVIVALSWMLLSVFGALPMCLTGASPSFVNALFEAVSGFTTTGASVLHDLDSLPKCVLMWRSFTHWVGGMGVLVFMMAFLPMAGGTNMYLMKAESPGPSVSKLVPRVRSTAKLLYLIYLALTLLEIILLLFGGMPLFDAITLSFATAGTGGFGISNAGMMIYSPFCIVVITVFMVLFGVNFTSYFLILHGKPKEAFNTEVRVFLAIVAGAIIAVTVNVRHLFGSVPEALMHSAFTVGSLVSSTGFATADFNLWPSFSKTVLVMLMFVGACAGSTGGGIKVSRIILFFKNMHSEFRVMTHPKQIKKVKLDGHPVEQDILRSVHVYFATFIMVYAVSLIILSFDGLDLTTNFTAVVATLNNIGPGLSEVGPAANFDVYSPLSKCVLIFDMLAGRLELFPVILLLSPATWKK